MPTPPNFFSIVLAGGSGTRLWPLSRSQMPKHLLPLNGEESLLQQAVRRLLPETPADRIVTVTHESHLFKVREQLSAIDPILAERILAEPVANNTLPAVAWGVAEIARKAPEAIVAVFPSDHAILDGDRFQTDLEAAIGVAQGGSLVTFGIKPSGPETGYGYIQAEGNRVLSFVEKPDRKTAERYLKEGNYYWNSGMFVFRVQDFLAELKRQEPAILEAVLKIVGSPGDQGLLKATYPAMKKISIDCGMMEKAQKVAVVPATFGWNDLGSWESVYQQLQKDKDQNAIQGDVLSLDTKSSLLISKNGLLAVIGLKDMVVVQTDDAVLVSPRDRVQEVKGVTERLKASNSSLVEVHSTAYRPWGYYTVLEEGVGHKVKRIVVNPGQKLSLQSHQKRSENWVVIEGVAQVTKGDKVITLKQSESIFIATGEKHRLANQEASPLTIIEVQTGSYLGEDDIERFDDVYGRVESPRGKGS